MKPTPLFWISRALFFVGALMFVIGAFLPWSGGFTIDAMRKTQVGWSFNAFRAGEESLAAILVGFLVILAGALTIRNRRSWPFRVSGFLEIIGLLSVGALIFLHAQDFGSARHVGRLTSISERVVGPYVGLVGIFLMILGSGTKLWHIFFGKTPKRKAPDDGDWVDDENRPPKGRRRQAR